MSLISSLPEASDQLPVLVSCLFSIVCGALFGFWYANRARRTEPSGKASEVAPEALPTTPEASPLIAGLSHEIRTPLNGIAGMTNFLVHSDLDEGQHECVQAIQSCVDALLALVNDILDYSKIEADRLEVECIDFDLRSTLEDTLDVFSVQAQARGVTFLLDVPEEKSLRFRGDPYRLRQILLNFVSNAIKFTKEGGQVTLAASFEGEAEDSAQMKLSVTDTGIGIAEDKLAGLFQAFQQADASTTREYGGTGLGLAISRGLAERLGGAVGAESVEGEGTTFWCEVKLEKQSNADSPSSADFKRAKVLVLDSNECARRLLVRQLVAWNVDVVEAKTVEEAATKFDEFEPRVGFIDAGQLSEEFSELSKRVKRRAGESLDLCLMRDKGVESDACAVARPELSRTVFKPIKQHQLLEALRRSLEPDSEAADETAPALPSGHEAESTQSLEGTHFRRLVRILVVDDNALNRKVAEKMLQRLGYQVQLAVDGQAALDAVGRSPFDLIFMDRQMPVMDGIEATRSIREREGDGRHTPIVALTADALQSARDECFEAGMDDFLVKPVSGEDLAAKINRWVNCAQV